MSIYLFLCVCANSTQLFNYKHEPVTDGVGGQSQSCIDSLGTSPPTTSIHLAFVSVVCISQRGLQSIHLIVWCGEERSTSSFTCASTLVGSRSQSVSRRQRVADVVEARTFVDTTATCHIPVIDCGPMCSLSSAFASTCAARFLFTCVLSDLHSKTSQTDVPHVSTRHQKNSPNEPYSGCSESLLPTIHDHKCI